MWSAGWWALLGRTLEVSKWLVRMNWSPGSLKITLVSQKRFCISQVLDGLFLLWSHVWALGNASFVKPSTSSDFKDKDLVTRDLTAKVEPGLRGRRGEWLLHHDLTDPKTFLSSSRCP